MPVPLEVVPGAPLEADLGDELELLLAAAEGVNPDLEAEEALGHVDNLMQAQVPAVVEDPLVMSLHDRVSTNGVLGRDEERQCELGAVASRGASHRVPPHPRGPYRDAGAASVGWEIVEGTGSQHGV